MLTLAATFSTYVLAVHILAVVVAFGVLFTYPVFVLVGLRREPAAAAWFHRMQVAIGRRVINPGLLLIVIAGVVLAANEHQWKSFYVQWGIGISLVIGGLEGALLIPAEKKLAVLADADTKGGQGPGAEYTALLRRAGAISAVMALLVVLTVFVMATHAGATG